MWDALDDAAKQRYKDDAPMVVVMPKKPRARARSRTPPPPPDEDLRRGKWTSEEEAYAEKLRELYWLGRLPEGPERPNDGDSCGVFVARRLNCGPMRVWKKFTGDGQGGSSKAPYVHDASLTEDLERFSRRRSTMTPAPRSTMSARPWRRSRRFHRSRGASSAARTRSQDRLSTASK
jgi:hypothetical protein